jgi:hypothetical protein
MAQAFTQAQLGISALPHLTSPQNVLSFRSVPRGEGVLADFHDYWLVLKITVAGFGIGRFDGL